MKQQTALLVPYFRDISALHLAQRKLQQQRSSLEQQKHTLQQHVQSTEHPRKPRYEAANGVFLLGLGIYLILLCCSMFIFGLMFLGCLCIATGIMSITIGGIRYLQVSKENHMKEKKYDEKMVTYLEILRRNSQNQKLIEQTENQMRRCEEELTLVQDALEQAYGIGLIPQRYRSMDTVIFLYILFGTGRTSSMETAFKLLSDRQIRDHLDRFIADKTDRLLKKYLNGAETPLPRVDTQALSDEEEKIYSALQNSHAVTTAFFANATALSQLYHNTPP